MKILVNIAHPNMQRSRVNASWKQELEQTQAVTINDLYEQYPDETINVSREQQLLLAHDRIVFQFPLFWYSSPPLLKKWMDDVLMYGWAYGTGGSALHGKELVLAISIGGQEQDYRAGGKNLFTVSELTRPFQATANLTGMNYLVHFVLHGAVWLDSASITKSATSYVEHITDRQLNPLTYSRRT
ncbi:NAD(P)H-dependent oxidoreductase [Alkalihalobacillus hemicellulosilyticus]|uniref:Glutathione-regulated potassium-efflux system ancillary protein KefG n=1 Tax=Halalkalibacter hemicellulosilyticusJCM 9152 TaxID=1236971 RepID=W4QKJ6_9BACI|nr:NAD(P)H-dependent oxidoreductase [Halalkalibacter hemicellulosilyticus]GAE32616.1 glutathione-regulated potassium-efflux system ancillary protein KefG [Halalkalibacter hemicellulosilyticusJCM 9152]